MQNYKDLKVWEESYKLSVMIYKASLCFPREEIYGLCNQLRRSSVSIAANIAEGKGRYYTKEFIRFLFIARGSLQETEHFCLLAKELKYLNDKSFKELSEQMTLAGKLLNGLIRALKKENEIIINNVAKYPVTSSE